MASFIGGGWFQVDVVFLSSENFLISFLHLDIGEHFLPRFCQTTASARMTFSDCACFALQKIEVDPVKFAAELESYEDLKRRLVVDAALFGAVGAFATFQVPCGWN